MTQTNKIERPQFFKIQLKSKFSNVLGAFSRGLLADAVVVPHIPIASVVSCLFLP
jgi:hypothetical protein